MKPELIIVFAILTVLVVYLLTQSREGLEVETKIADEGQRAQVANGTMVKYGAGTHWTKRLMSGSFTCNNSTFGDPAPGAFKACYKVETKPDPKPTPPVVTPTPSPPSTTSVAPQAIAPISAAIVSLASGGTTTQGPPPPSPAQSVAPAQNTQGSAPPTPTASSTQMTPQFCNL